MTGRTVRRRVRSRGNVRARACSEDAPALAVSIALAAGVGSSRRRRGERRAFSTPRLRRRPPRDINEGHRDVVHVRHVRELRARRAPGGSPPHPPRGLDGKVHCKKCLGCSVILRRLSPSKAMLGK